MRILIFDCHKNKISESEKIRNAFLLADRSLQIDIVEARKFPQFNLENYDAFVISGADFSNKKYLWLRMLKETLQRIIGLNKLLLGICFGNELIGEIFGFEVINLDHPEIGWANIELTEAGRNNSLFNNLPNSFPVFEHHKKTVLVPENAQAKILAKNENCAQAIKYSNFVYGIQFHAEETPESGTEFLRSDSKCKNFEESTRSKPEVYIGGRVFGNFVNLIAKK